MVDSNDAPVSEAQRKAMGAAMGGHSTLGIPKAAGKEFIDKDPGGKLPEKSKDATSPKPGSGPMSPNGPQGSEEGLPKTTRSFGAGDGVGKAMSLDEIKSQAKRIGRY
jgi:hypothetical protein